MAFGKESRQIDLSCATIVNLLPRVIKEVKPGLHPSEFIIPKGSPEKPGLLIISGDVHHLVNPDILSDSKDIQMIKVLIPALQCASSIINDYVQSLIAVDGESFPAIFAVKGDYSNPEEVKTKFADKIEEFRVVQNRWFTTLVAIADDTWAKTKSPQGISDLQRDAANSLQLKKEWLGPAVDAEKCKFCGAVASSIVCPNCHHVLDEAKYRELNPVLAGVK